jgi:hypothetical protein
LPDIRPIHARMSHDFSLQFAPACPPFFTK